MVILMCIKRPLAVASALLWIMLAAGCSEPPPGRVKLRVPRGYAAVLEIDRNGHLLRFGPFVGYYFRPPDPDDLGHLHFVCFNEQNFYTLDRPANAKLYRGTAVFAELPEAGFEIHGDEARIRPVFFEEAPAAWLQTRPEPQGEFLHFHSCYDAAGPVRSGYWLRHTAEAEFVYDMGGRVGPDSPLYHTVLPGVDREFARIVEFDRGPAR
jgi:hypothetical protein